MRELTIGILGSIIVLGILIWLVIMNDRTATVEPEDMNIVCLEGVEYWYRQSGHKGMLAVKYNTDGTVSLCEGN